VKSWAQESASLLARGPLCTVAAAASLYTTRGHTIVESPHFEPKPVNLAV